MPSSTSSDISTQCKQQDGAIVAVIKTQLSVVNYYYSLGGRCFNSAIVQIIQYSYAYAYVGVAVLS